MKGGKADQTYSEINIACDHQDKKNNQKKGDKAGKAIAISVITPSWESADGEDQQYYDQNR